MASKRIALASQIVSALSLTVSPSVPSVANFLPLFSKSLVSTLPSATLGSRFSSPSHVVGNVWATASGASSSRAFCQVANNTVRKPPKRRGAAELGLYWGAAAIGMVGASYAMVPLYKMFCAATGYGGAVNGAKTVEGKMRKRQENPNAKVEKAAEQREITVWFNGDVAQNMPWEFVPTQQCVRVRPGQSTLVFFTAKNKTDKPITGYSVYNVTPDKAAVYFNKIQCFCFEEQRLRGNEEVDMPVFFYLDPEMATDWNCRNVDDITLSYMFHKVADEDLDEEAKADDAPTLIKLHGPGQMAAAGAKFQPDC